MRGYYAMIVAALAVVAAGVPAGQIPWKASVSNPKCPSSGTARMPHPEACALYYICQDGESTIYECPEGLHFNTAIEQCDWPPAGCLAGRRPETQPETQPNIPEDEDEDEDEDEANTSDCIGTCPISDSMDRTILLPYGSDCTKYCKCSNGKPFIMSCPDDLHFDAKNSVCNWKWAAKCQSETKPNIPEDEDEDEANTPGCIGTCPISDSVDRTILLPYAGDCTKYCTCSNGRPFIMLCPGDLHFDAKNSVCNWKWAAKCQS